MKNKKGIYKFNFDYGRMGSIDGVFIATKNDIKKIMGEQIYFGEVLGKHSEVVCDIDEENITFVTDDQKIVEIFEKHNLTSGYNPLDYYEEEDDEEDEDEEGT